MTDLQFTTEYGAEFVEESDSYFSAELIMNCISEVRQTNPKWNDYYLGVDFARLGEDSSVFTIVQRTIETGKCEVLEIIETKGKRLTDAVGRIKMLDEKYHFKKVILDETGMGSGPTDFLLEDFAGRIEPVTFTVKSKMDIYSNLKVIMEKGLLKYAENKKLIYQLRDLRYEAMSSGQLKIHHSERGHDDYTDSIALACWPIKGMRKLNWVIG